MQPERPDQSRTAPPSPLVTVMVLGTAFLAVLILFSGHCALGPASPEEYPSRTLPSEPQPVLLPPPAMDDEYFPCSDCHGEEPTNRTVRALEDDHEDHELAHGELWCLHCHDVDDRDRLRLADDLLISFEESWRLCTQCHANKLADWRAGVHGKRTGYWWGPKEYRTCVVCHDPHSPHFKPLEPKPPPKRPEEIRLVAREQEELSHAGR
jgi:hypothetical protein